MRRPCSRGRRSSRPRPVAASAGRRGSRRWSPRRSSPDRISGSQLGPAQRPVRQLRRLPGPGRQTEALADVGESIWTPRFPSNVERSFFGLRFLIKVSELAHAFQVCCVTLTMALGSGYSCVAADLTHSIPKRSAMLVCSRGDRSLAIRSFASADAVGHLATCMSQIPGRHVLGDMLRTRSDDELLLLARADNEAFACFY